MPKSFVSPPIGFGYGKSKSRIEQIWLRVHCKYYNLNFQGSKVLSDIPGSIVDSSVAINSWSVCAPAGWVRGSLPCWIWCIHWTTCWQLFPQLQEISQQQLASYQLAKTAAAATNPASASNPMTTLPDRSYLLYLGQMALLRKRFHHRNIWLHRLVWLRATSKNTIWSHRSSWHRINI